MNVAPAASREDAEPRRYLPWLGLLAVSAIYCFLVLHLRPANLFGLTEDDTIYFSSAREIASGRGYTLPHVPGRPAATKYPVLYPWLLSWIWRWDPSFPQNLSAAVILNLVFGCGFIAASFAFFRRVAKLGNSSSLLLTALGALTSKVLFSSALIMSDVLFATLALLACLVASLPESEDKYSTAIAAGILSGAATLTRTVGAPIAVGLWLAQGWRGGWKRALAFGVSLLPFAFPIIWHPAAVAPGRGAASPACAHSWQMSWLYYSNYLGFWRADTLANHALWQTMKANVFFTLLQPGSYFLSASSVLRSLVVSTALLTMVSALVIRGIVRDVQQLGLRPIHFALVLYLGPLLVWNYTDPGRFLLPFLPLFAAGLWAELRHVAGLIGAQFAQRRRADQPVAAVFLCAAGVALVLVGVASWWHNFRSFENLSDSRRHLLAEKKQAYDWLRENSPSDARLIAYEDALAYLYSGRLALRPTIFSTAGTGRAGLLDAELSCLTSNALVIDAQYWIIADDDFGFEWEPAKSRALAKEKEVAPKLPLLFQSSEDRVRIYRLPSGEPRI